MNYEKQKLLVQVARLYYENDWGQEKIAGELNLSRPYVSKLLKEAKASGIVQIRVVDPAQMESPLEEEFSRRFGLKKTIIVAEREHEDGRDPMSVAAARYLNEIVKDGDVIASSWGNTLFRLSNALVKRTDLSNTVYFQLCGGVSNVNSAVHANEIATNFSRALGCKAYLLQMPAIVKSKKLKELVLAEDDAVRIANLAERANVSVFTVGSFGERNALVQAGYLSAADMEDLVEKGGVGDICSHVINNQGQICDQELDQRTIAIPLETIRKSEYRIGIAQGAYKVESIRAALKSGIMNVFVTTAETARTLLEGEM